VGRWDANLDLSRVEARGCQWAWGRDFLSVKAATERQAVLVHWAAQHPGRQRQGAQQKAVHLPEQRAVPQPALQAVPQALRGEESELALGPALPVRWASWLRERRQAQVPSVPGAWEQRPQGRLALLPAQESRQARSASQPQARRWLGRAQLASDAQLSQQHPWLLFPLWQPLPPELRLRQLPESACAPSPRHRPESSSNASSFQ